MGRPQLSPNRQMEEVLWRIKLLRSIRPANRLVIKSLSPARNATQTPRRIRRDCQGGPETSARNFGSDLILSTAFTEVWIANCSGGLPPPKGHHAHRAPLQQMLGRENSTERYIATARGNRNYLRG